MIKEFEAWKKKNKIEISIKDRNACIKTASHCTTVDKFLRVLWEASWRNCLDKMNGDKNSEMVLVGDYLITLKEFYLRITGKIGIKKFRKIMDSICKDIKKENDNIDKINMRRKGK